MIQDMALPACRHASSIDSDALPFLVLQVEETRIALTPCRVEPSASAKSFVVHGSACKKQEAFPTCTHQSGSSIPGKMYVVDIGDVMGADFQVGSTPVLDLQGFFDYLSQK